MSGTETEVIDQAADEAVMLEEFEKLAAAEPGGTPEEQEAAPSTEGVVTSEAPKQEPGKPEAKEPPKEQPKEQPKRNLGGLSTEALLDLIADPDAPAEDKRRAVEIRLRREENARAGREKKQSTAEPYRQAAQELNKNMQELRQDFPEIASKIDPLTKVVDTLHRQASEQDARIEQQQAMERLEKTFPKFVDVVNSPEFPQWLGSQSADVKRAFREGGEDGAFNVLSSYEDHVITTHGRSPFVPQSQAAPAPAAPSREEKAAQIQERRQKLLQQAPVTPTKARGETNTQPAEDDFEASFDYFAKKAGLV